jgi:hypothetical protein
MKGVQQHGSLILQTILVINQPIQQHRTSADWAGSCHHSLFKLPISWRFLPNNNTLQLSAFMLLITPADFTSFQFLRQLEFKYVKSVMESSLLFLEGLWQFKLCTTKTKTTMCRQLCRRSPPVLLVHPQNSLSSLSINASLSCINYEPWRSVKVFPSLLHALYWSFLA